MSASARLSPVNLIDPDPDIASLAELERVGKMHSNDYTSSLLNLRNNWELHLEFSEKLLWDSQSFVQHVFDKLFIGPEKPQRGAVNYASSISTPPSSLL